ncbi:Succinate dehydrogenase ubiquinone cytochrome b small subunit, mitochondrial [Hondaea fermentalgiana]|uniref:Succinate dehydrogenase [ubiquinone] cytochrome b small subunit n=1 Tax=Hondaea fermentalgiana TaxID=2315210 RepID=A0A2R5GCY6_9STRA|nr:Succinate dehydrogenase ubiquinone cytochrome b small subunit, mitochondrial [Hondaea fermentalgiana]|eukprot:GBG28842.1 Succinate dehydrogenase ubiquinone cytochrome b small subunit, mitochondrial [Hondaea fermentalgiana]
MLRTMMPMGRQLASAGLVGARPALRLTATRSMATKSDAPFSLVAADQSIAVQKLFHQTSLASLALTPIAVLAHPSFLSMPIDIVLSVVFPLHAHIGINWILTDYVPAATPNSAIRYGVLAVTGLTILGLLKVSIVDEGLVGTLKATWSSPEELKKSRDSK